MAYLLDTAATGATAGWASATAMNMPDHQADDVLVMFCAVDTGSITITGTGWTVIGTNPTSQTIITAAYWKKATSAAETISLTTGDASSVIIACFREVDTTTAFDVAANYAGVGTATSTPASASLTTVTADALVVSMIAQEGTNPMVVSQPGAMSAFMGDSGGTSATQSAQTSMAWTIQRTAGATPALNWISNVSGVYVRLTFALRPAAGSKVPAYIDDAVTPASIIHVGSHTSALNGASTSTNGITATIAGKTATPTTATLLVDSGLNPYLSILTSATAATAVTALVGPEITITTAKDCTGKLVAGAAMAANWKQARFGAGSVKQGGVVVRLGSGSTGTTNWNAYQVSAKDAQVPPATPAVFVIEPGYATTAYATGAGGNCSVSALKYVQILRNAPLFSSQVGLTECWLIDKQVIAGGDSTAPVDLDGMVEVGNSFRLPLIQKAGASSVVCFAPIQIGGGDAVYLSVDSGVIQFPARAAASSRDLQYHASDNKLGLYLAGKSGDTIKLTNSLVTSPIAQIFEITSTATSSAAWDFTGSTIKGMTATLRPVVTFSNMTFSSCPTVTTTGSTITSCAFVNSKAVASSPANAALISGCTFAKSTGTSHAIEIGGTAADMTLTDVDFAGYASGNGSTGNEAIYVNIASGSMSITISGGTTPSIRTAGASVTVISGAELTITNLQSGSDIVILTNGTTTVRESVDQNSGSTYVYSYTDPGAVVDICAYKAGYIPWQLRGVTLAATNGSLQVTQAEDVSYIT